MPGFADADKLIRGGYVYPPGAIPVPVSIIRIANYLTLESARISWPDGRHEISSRDYTPARLFVGEFLIGFAVPRLVAVFAPFKRLLFFYTLFQQRAMQHNISMYIPRYVNIIALRFQYKLLNK